ncbi:hypothetical protein D3C78_1790090 [compost metagenome]
MLAQRLGIRALLQDLLQQAVELGTLAEGIILLGGEVSDARRQLLGLRQDPGEGKVDQRRHRQHAIQGQGLRLIQ